MSKSESGDQLLARLGTRPNLEGLAQPIFQDGPKGGDVIELFGAESTGKTELLLHCITRCILPQKWLTFDLGGLGAKVVFIDTDYKFGILRLAILLEKYIMEIIEAQCKAEKPSVSESDKFITDCLKNLLLVRCISSEQLICTLHNLEVTIRGDGGISCLMIDSISAFYWIDRSNHGEMQCHEKNMNKIVDVLQVIAKTYKIVVMATKASIFKNKPVDKGNINQSPFMENKSYSHSRFDEYLGKAWNNLVNERVVLRSEVSYGKTCFIATHKALDVPIRFFIEESGVKFV